MTDRELLELAAKAAGYDYRPENGVIVVDGIPGNWNPLDDDGDAFRLMVGIGMNVGTPRRDSEDDDVFIEWVPPTKGSVEGFWVEEPIGADWRHDTRRAIVRCAAELQRQKERK